MSKSRSKPARGQLELPFALRRKALRLRLTLSTNAKHLLRVLDDWANEGGYCWPSHEKMADAMDSSRDKVKRALAELRLAGLVTVVSRPNRERGSNCYKVVRSELLARAGLLDAIMGPPDEWDGDQPPQDPPAAPPETPTDGAPVRYGSEERWRTGALCYKEEVFRDGGEDTKEEKTPPPAAAPAIWDEAARMVVVKEMTKLKIVDTTVLGGIVSRGCTPAHVLELLSHAASNPGAWAPGAIHHRLKVARPDLPASEGWLPPRAAVRIAADREKRREQLRADASKTAQAREERESRLAAERALESECGAILDGLDAVERDRLVEDLFGADAGAMRLYRKDGASGILRPKILRELARRLEVR